jgi:serine/threonine-protein kinase RsbW
MPTVENGWTFDKTIPSDLDVAHGAIEELMRALEAAGWPGGDMFRIQMAIEEAVVNAIEHGNKRDVSKTVHVLFHVDAERATMQISDQGTGFDHRNVADPTEEERLDKPRGRGVMLMRELMTEANFNESGNSVTMIKVRSQEVPETTDE